VSKARVNFLKRNQVNGDYFHPEIYFFVRSEAQKFKKQKFWEAEKKFIQLAKDQYENHRDKFSRDIRRSNHL